MALIAIALILSIAGIFALAVQQRNVARRVNTITTQCASSNSTQSECKLLLRRLLDAASSDEKDRLASYGRSSSDPSGAVGSAGAARSSRSAVKRYAPNVGSHVAGYAETRSGASSSVAASPAVGPVGGTEPPGAVETPRFGAEVTFGGLSALHLAG